MARVLNTIEGSIYAGELRRLYSRGLRQGRTCACGRAHAACPVWSKLLVPGATYLEPSLGELRRIQNRAAPDHRSWAVALRHLRRRSPPAPGTPSARYLSAYSDLHRAFAEVTDSTIVINSSKSPAEAALLRFARDLSVYCVQMVRDPRGVALSFQNHAKRTTGVAAHLMAVRASLLWVTKHALAEVVRRTYGPHRSFLVRYERFTEDPRSTVEDVARMLGEPPPALPLSSGIAITVPEAHGPDGSRWLRFVGTEVTVKFDDRWRSELGRVDRFLVTLVTAPLLVRYGYPIRTRQHRSRGPETSAGQDGPSDVVNP